MGHAGSADACGCRMLQEAAAARALVKPALPGTPVPTAGQMPPRIGYWASPPLAAVLTAGPPTSRRSRVPLPSVHVSAMRGAELPTARAAGGGCWGTWGDARQSSEAGPATKERGHVWPVAEPSPNLNYVSTLPREPQERTPGLLSFRRTSAFAERTFPRPRDSRDRCGSWVERRPAD